MLESPLLNRIEGFIAGSWCGADSGELFTVTNPATGEALAEVPRMGARETSYAVGAADHQVKSPLSIESRESLLSEIGQAIVQNRGELARVITYEHGKPLTEAAAEADYAASFFHFYASQVKHLRPRLLAQQPRGHRWRIFSRPAGVAALITPWNFPIAMLAKKLSAALAAGCACVVKPSSKTPLTTIALFAILKELGLPPGAVNLITGPAAEISECLCRDPRVRVISFTGSTQVGRSLMKQAAEHLKRLSLELGGNAPFLVFDDADLQIAADQLIQNKFRASGQTCVCANRIYVHQNVQETFVRLLGERVGRLIVGNGLDQGTDIGPLIDGSAFAKVKEHLDDAVQKGAVVVAGSSELSKRAENFGHYFPPVVLTGVKENMRCVSEETFGPLVPIISFQKEEEVLEAANATEFGLAAYVFTSDEERGRRVIAVLQFGHVGLNSGTGPAAVAPFGGFKQSGFGREGGLEGLHDFIEYQTVASPLQEQS